MAKKKSRSRTRSRKSAGNAQSVDWSLLVYFAGDNNLTSEMVWGLQELSKTSTDLSLAHKRVNVVAHFDPGGLRSRRYDLALTSQPRKSPPGEKIRDGGLDSSVVYGKRFVDSKVRGRRNLEKLSGSGRSLSAFVMSQVERLDQSKSFLVVLSGHGSGAEGDFLIDADPTTSLSIPELRAILSESRRSYYLKFHKNRNREWSDTDDYRIGVLGMDSCLMSNVEVCYEVRNSVDYLVASEGFVENTGWPYHRVVEAMLGKNGSRTNRLAAARKIATSYSDFYRDYEVSGVSTDIAVCDIAAFRTKNGLMKRLRELAGKLIPRLERCHALQIVSLAPRKKQSERQLARLAKGIAGTLKTPELEALLQRGSKSAKQILEGDDLPRDVEISKTGSAKAALLELVESLDANYTRAEPGQEKSLRKLLIALPKKLKAKVPDPAVCLAIVRALREFDPGVQEALKRIEKLESQGKPETKKAREMLLRFHHLRQVMELGEFSECQGGLTEEDRRTLDALVAARWDAQSFKGGVYVDLYDLCVRIQDRLPRVGNLTRLRNAIVSQPPIAGDAVVQSYTTGADFQHAHGLSVYFPVRAVDYTDKYVNLQFARDTGWGRMVRAYLEATRKPRRNETSLSLAEHIRRFSLDESDSLHSESVEARIGGGGSRVDWEPFASAGRAGTSESARAGTSESARAGTSESARAGTSESARAGTSESARAGTSESARAGTSESARGKKVLVAFGNPPDGFYRSEA